MGRRDRQIDPAHQLLLQAEHAGRAAEILHPQLAQEDLEIVDHARHHRIDLGGGLGVRHLQRHDQFEDRPLAARRRQVDQHVGQIDEDRRRRFGVFGPGLALGGLLAAHEQEEIGGPAQNQQDRQAEEQPHLDETALLLGRRLAALGGAVGRFFRSFFLGLGHRRDPMERRGHQVRAAFGITLGGRWLTAR